MMENIQLSVVIPVLARTDNLEALFDGYEAAIAQLGVSYEFIVVVDGGNNPACDTLTALQAKGANFKLLKLARHFGESTALSAGFDEATGELLLTLPAYNQVDPASLGVLFDSIDDHDLVVARRWPRAGGAFETFRRDTFHFLVKALSGESYRDLGCAVRLMRRRVIDEIDLYGDQHRFFPVLAGRVGFRVVEVDVRQSPDDRFEGRYRIREYLHRLLDIITVFFLVRFTKKPLRFFGMVGSLVSALGALTVLTLVAQRLFFGVALADRPALLLGSLLLVLGVQVFALGLVGELIIFTHARNLKEYKVAEIIETQGRQTPDPLDDRPAVRSTGT